MFIVANLCKCFAVIKKVTTGLGQLLVTPMIFFIALDSSAREALARVSIAR